MPIDSNSLQTKLRLLSDWYNLPETQWLLNQLQELGAEASSRVINSCPSNLQEQNAREQDIGATKAYMHPIGLVSAQIETYKQELKEANEATHPSVES